MMIWKYKNIQIRKYTNTYVKNIDVKNVKEYVKKVYIYVHIYINIHTHTHIYIKCKYIYIYIIYIKL